MAGSSVEREVGNKVKPVEDILKTKLVVEWWGRIVEDSELWVETEDIEVSFGKEDESGRVASTISETDSTVKSRVIEEGAVLVSGTLYRKDLTREVVKGLEETRSEREAEAE